MAAFVWVVRVHQRFAAHAVNTGNEESDVGACRFNRAVKAHAFAAKDAGYQWLTARGRANVQRVQLYS
jgi:hypothetical protein